MNIALNCYGPIATGLGTEARWFAKLMRPTRWIVGEHHLRPKQEDWEGIEGKIQICDTKDISFALDGIDAIACIERPLPPALIAEARSRGIRTVLLTNPEWTTPSGGHSHAELFDVLVARTDAAMLHAVKLCTDASVVRADLPICLDEFPFTLRERAERAVYVHGWGGVADRKGWPEVQAMLKHVTGDGLALWTDPNPIHGLTIKSQRNRQNVVAKSADLYADADVLLMPSRFEGLGLPMLEAMASGCLVLATNAPPMSEFIHAAYKCQAQEMLLPVSHTSVVKTAQPWTAHHCDPAKIAERLRHVRSFPAEKVRLLSQMGRDYVERVHGASAVAKLREVICG